MPPSAQTIANAQQPSNWTHKHDDFAKTLIGYGESADTIVELLMTEYPGEFSNTTAFVAWIWKLVQET